MLPCDCEIRHMWACYVTHHNLTLHLAFLLPDKYVGIQDVKCFFFQRTFHTDNKKTDNPSLNEITCSRIFCDYDSLNQFMLKCCYLSKTRQMCNKEQLVTHLPVLKFRQIAKEIELCKVCKT